MTNIIRKFNSSLLQTSRKFMRHRMMASIAPVLQLHWVRQQRLWQCSWMDTALFLPKVWLPFPFLWLFPLSISFKFHGAHTGCSWSVKINLTFSYCMSSLCRVYGGKWEPTHRGRLWVITSLPEGNSKNALKTKEWKQAGISLHLSACTEGMISCVLTS